MKSLLNNFSPILLIIFIFGCKSDSGNSDSSDSSNSNNAPTIIEEKPLSEEELKEQLHETECNDRVKYIDGTMRYTARYKSLLSMKVNGLVLTFDLTNDATLATLKDIEIRVSFLAVTGATIFEDDVIVYQFIEPGNSISYKTEIDCSNQQYNDIDDFAWTVIDAACD